MNFLITQRVDVIKKEIRDSLDQNWFNLFNNLKVNLFPISNCIKNPSILFDNLKCRGVILSGGNDLGFIKDYKISNVSFLRDKLEIKILNLCVKKKIPVLGVCRGMQIINYFFNKDIKFNISNFHVGKDHEIFLNNNRQTYLFRNRKKMFVNSFHRFVIPKNQVSNCLETLYVDGQDNAEVVIHRKLPIVGIMWHPERFKKIDYFTKNLFKTFFNI